MFSFVILRVVENGDTVVRNRYHINNTRNMLCSIRERVESKIRERGYEEKIRQLYMCQLSSESCQIKMFSSSTVSQ
jgi:hypothetical protein